MAYLSEAAVEQVVLDHLAGLGYTRLLAMRRSAQMERPPNVKPMPM